MGGSIAELSGHGIVYGSRNKIMAWHSGLKSPFQIAGRDGFPECDSHVTSLALIDGVLYDGGYDGLVRGTLTGRQQGEVSKSQEWEDPLICKLSPVFGISSYGGKIIVLHNKTNLYFRDENGENNYVFTEGAVVKNLEDPHIYALAVLGQRDSQGRGPNLNFRSKSLDMATANGILYVSSQNVVLLLRTNTSTEKLMALGLTPFHSDFVQLASDGNEVYAISNGYEVRSMPDNQIIAFWKPDDNFKVTEECYGYTNLATLVGNVLVIGNVYSRASSAKGKFYAVPITDEMRSSENGVMVSPQLLVDEAFEVPKVYGSGNPLVAVPIPKLEQILKEAILS